MPNIKLPTGVDLYYETHGQGEPLIFVPSTAYSGEVWKPSQMPLAQSLNIIFHDPRGCGRSVATQSVYTIEQMALDIVALMDHLKLACGASDRPFDGRPDRAFAGRELSRSREELDHGGKRFRAGGETGLGLYSWLAASFGARHGGNGLREICSRRNRRFGYFLYPRVSRTPSRQSRSIFQARLGDARQAAGVHSPLHRAP